MSTRETFCKLAVNVLVSLLPIKPSVIIDIKSPIVADMVAEYFIAVKSSLVTLIVALVDTQPVGIL